MNEAELVFSEVLGCDRAALYLNRTSLLPKVKLNRIVSILKRRTYGEPLEYILGKSDFLGFEFKVSKDVLIPRPETEILVETVIKQVTPSTTRRTSKSQGYQVTGLNVLDLGTGSGCISVCLAKLLPHVSITAVDISEAALKIAKYNAKINNVEGKINFMNTDLFSGLRERFDIIVTNPPYVQTGEIDILQREIQYEPSLALDGGRDGFDFYRKIISASPSYLGKNGLLIMEMGFGQKENLENLLQKEKKFEIMEVIKDYNNIDRVIVCQLSDISCQCSV